MTRFFSLMLVLFFSCAAAAQSKVLIDLKEWKGNKGEIPFSISSVKDNRPMSGKIGTIDNSKKRKTNIEFKSNSAPMIHSFIEKNYTQGTELDIQMDIEVLEIQKAEKKGKEIPYFVFACKFYKQDDFTQPLYSFNARNSIPRKKSLKEAMTNYIGRALSASILNFKKSAQKHPEWKKSNANSPNVKVTNQTVYNKFEQLGDTIALDGKYQLQDADFAGVVQDEEKDAAYSFFMLSYSLDVVDEKNKVAVKVFPKAFFLRSKSWAKKSDTTNWKSHQQLLFDLASYHGLLLKKALETNEYSAGFYKSEANKIYNEISMNYFDEMDQLQAETLYGTLKKKEVAWREKVNKYLGRE